MKLEGQAGGGAAALVGIFILEVGPWLRRSLKPPLLLEKISDRDSRPTWVSSALQGNNSGPSFGSDFHSRPTYGATVSLVPYNKAPNSPSPTDSAPPYASIPGKPLR